ncbi:hypothetical protein LT330_000546 [Penicillium expansum]|uniref:PX domain-containing protein n=1 Tax=Penicillium expansum TaxID=27334 RepID=A0A0A2JLD2_PENEN|nr:hypothetical protein PEX2_077710 [Penicillium expansum]KAK4871309.1 hypothetical protein LT330_000546 [Penicillium expansum]KGO42122.1 hypothetical protein PEXP_050720 [Penicillium expansum]KGO56164.1 hypothetical protein PEX2_077710 [Penicillium expansum]
MAPTVEISIPNATLSHTSPPYTVYHITLRLPLRSFTVPKRYSDFATFHSALISQTNAPPPAPLPSKTWFSKTVSNDRLREDRRRGLEEYLRAINEAEDGRWRTSPAWRAFLNLPTAVASTGTGSTTTSSRLHAAITDPAATNAPITDPTLWLDYYRDMKNHLHDARLQLSRRDQETTPQKQHESSAQAKGSLVRAGTMITTLDDGLKNLGRGDKGSQSQSSSLGGGEIRRRKDLLINARKEKDGLEDLLHAMATKSRLDHTVASIQDKGALINAGNVAGDAFSGRRTPTRTGRVLGKETERTRELDNEGVLQLQRQMMQSQDDNVDELRKIIIRQRELGTQINEELEVQNDLLRLADEEADMFVHALFSLLALVLAHFTNDISRLKSKMDIGRKRIDKIS